MILLCVPRILRQSITWTDNIVLVDQSQPDQSFLMWLIELQIITAGYYKLRPRNHVRQKPSLQSAVLINEQEKSIPRFTMKIIEDDMKKG